MRLNRPLSVDGIQGGCGVSCECDGPRNDLIGGELVDFFGMAGFEFDDAFGEAAAADGDPEGDVCRNVTAGP